MEWNECAVILRQAYPSSAEAVVRYGNECSWRVPEEDFRRPGSAALKTMYSAPLLLSLRHFILVIF